MPFRLEAGVNRSIVPGETIAAISTAAGEAAIALIRISGKDAIEVADKVFRGKQRPSDLASQTQHLGEIGYGIRASVRDVCFPAEKQTGIRPEKDRSWRSDLGLLAEEEFRGDE